MRDDAAAFAPMLGELSSRIGGRTLFYGDSITTAANSSGMIGFEPYIPGWPKQVHDGIVDATGNTGLEYVNTAVGGKNTQWGLDNVQERVIAYAPDFVLIAFGMNDTLSVADYSAKHEAMVNAIHSALPNATVMLVPPMMPNLEATGYVSRGTLFPQYEQVLVALVAQFRAAGFARIGCANVNTMHAAVLARKRYRDMTGNNINHCNDFSARIYRDTILAAMGLPKNPASNWEPCRTGKVRGWFGGGVAEGWPNAASKFGGVWRRIPGLRAKVDVPVDVEIEFAYGAEGTRVQYRLDGEASEWLETAVERVGGVGVRGNLHSLAARCENLVPSNGLVIRMAAF